MSFRQNGTLTMRHRTAVVGFWCWGLCDACHRATSPWDDEFIRFSQLFAATILKSQYRGNRIGVGGRMNDVRPGRFARAAVAGLIGWADGLRDDEPDFVSAVKTGAPLTSDPGHRLLLAVTPSDKALVHSSHGGVGVTIAGPVALASVAVHFPPFSFVIAPASSANDFPHTDITDWLKLGPDDLVNDWPVQLPAVRARDPQPWSGLATRGGFEATTL